MSLDDVLGRMLSIFFVSSGSPLVMYLNIGCNDMRYNFAQYSSVFLFFLDYVNKIACTRGRHKLCW